MKLPPRLAATGTAVFAFALLCAIATACRRRENATDAARPAASAAAAAPHASSSDCRACHAEIFAAWSGSDHAHAHRPVDAARDADAFTPARSFAQHGVEYHVAWDNNRPAFTEQRAGHEPAHFTPEFALGYKPLRQYVVPVGGGRYQLTELAFDPARKEWFNVFDDERRQPGEWGHWLGRGMNWNSMCAHCHLTDFHKNYDATNDTYASTWREHGVGCYQCHGDLPADHGKAAPAASRAAKLTPEMLAATRRRAQETCAPCHARNELLTGDVQPGVPYSDHYRLQLPTEARVFYPDGQMRDEDFNYTSLLLSRMGGKAGVTCLDCHDPHSGHTLRPVENNALCLQCHAAPTRLNAPAIDPVAHSHHAAGSTGNRCVSCHMPTTTFMQRDPRHDHGFLRPDPLLTKELGIPNACNRCHTDRSADWAVAQTDAWYGAKMNSRQRERARGVAAAQAGAPHAAEKLLALLGSEDIPAWKATLLLLARPFAAGDAAVVQAAQHALSDPEPLVRSAAVQVLGTLPDRAVLRPLLKDPSRLVRLDAAWAVSSELADDSSARRELDAYLAVHADQPTGLLRRAQDLANRGRMADAEAPLRRAAEWDPHSPAIPATLGLVLNSLGRDPEAAASFWRAAQLDRTDAGLSFDAALAFAAAGKPADAELALRETIRRDPHHDRAWYNLGLLLAQTNRRDEALGALRQAETLAPDVADYPYARATLLWQSGDRAGALAAARRTLELDPQHAGARAMTESAR